MMSSELLLGASTVAVANTSTVAATAAAFSDSVGIIDCFGLCIWNKGMLVAYYEMSFVSVAISNNWCRWLVLFKMVLWALSFRVELSPVKNVKNVYIPYVEVQ